MLHNRAFSFSLTEEDVYRLKVYGMRLTALPVAPTSARAGMRCHLVSLQVTNAPPPPSPRRLEPSSSARGSFCFCFCFCAWASPLD